jgi:hypothetical protein
VHINQWTSTHVICSLNRPAALHTTFDAQFDTSIRSILLPALDLDGRRMAGHVNVTAQNL